jgi:hypothetical protein
MFRVENNELDTIEWRSIKKHTCLVLVLAEQNNTLENMLLLNL